MRVLVGLAVLGLLGGGLLGGGPGARGSQDLATWCYLVPVLAAWGAVGRAWMAEHRAQRRAARPAPLDAPAPRRPRLIPFGPLGVGLLLLLGGLAGCTSDPGQIGDPGARATATILGCFP